MPASRAEKFLGRMTEGQGDSIEWSGYIVENGPGDVPFKMSGWREENLVPISGSFFVNATLSAGGGQASHIGIFTDIKEVGLMNVMDGSGRGMGIAKAANGDLFIWVSRGAMNPSTGGFEFQIFFAGGTGRFEHAVGSFAGEVSYTTFPTSYTYKGLDTTDNGTDTIRY